MDLSFLKREIVFGHPDQLKDLADMLGPLASFKGSHMNLKFGCDFRRLF